MPKRTIFEQIKADEKKNLDLKKFEKIEIGNRGFFVRRNNKNNYIYSVIFFLLAGYIITSLLGFFSWMFLGLIIMSASFDFFEKIEMMLMYLPHFLSFFLIFIRLMIATVFGQNEYYFGKGNKPIKRFYNNWNNFKWSLIGISNPLKENEWLYLFTIFILLVVIHGLSLFVYEFLGLYGVLVYLIVPFISLLVFYPLKLLGVAILEIFHPLYAFGNIGEKIQKLTPKIEEKSNEIQKNFQQDMNFSLLSTGFDSLSSTFSTIVSLVIKLEGVEKRANKGNLFDSEKYIYSLRSDIVEPLRGLKVFLENQKEELLNSQKQLEGIRIGGSDDESVKNLELSGMRSESLLSELTENIGKLDQMIGKMEE